MIAMNLFRGENSSVEGIPRLLLFNRSTFCAQCAQNHAKATRPIPARRPLKKEKRYTMPVISL